VPHPGSPYDASCVVYMTFHLNYSTLLIIVCTYTHHTSIMWWPLQYLVIYILGGLTLIPVLIITVIGE
jgi:hypothetical protein